MKENLLPMADEQVQDNQDKQKELEKLNEKKNVQICINQKEIFIDY